MHWHPGLAATPKTPGRGGGGGGRGFCNLFSLSHIWLSLTASNSRLTFTSTWYLRRTVQIPQILIFTKILLLTSHTSHNFRGSRLTFTSTWYLTHTVQIPHILFFTMIRLFTSHTSRNFRGWRSPQHDSNSVRKYTYYSSCLEVTQHFGTLKKASPIVRVIVRYRKTDIWHTGDSSHSVQKFRFICIKSSIFSFQLLV